jgi:hypothetical protein
MSAILKLKSDGAQALLAAALLLGCALNVGLAWTHVGQAGSTPYSFSGAPIRATKVSRAIPVGLLMQEAPSTTVHRSQIGRDAPTVGRLHLFRPS